MYKKTLGLLACLGLVLGLTACTEPKQEGPDYADDEAMEVIASGFEKRSDVIYAQDLPDGDAGIKKNYTEAVKAELSVVEALKDRQFEDSQLQEKVIAYINTLNDSLKILDDYPISSYEFTVAWQETYDARTVLLKDFVDNYGLSVGEKYQGDFDEVIANGKTATEKKQAKEAIEKLISTASWECVDEGFGSYTYSAVIENTSEYNFENTMLLISLYDAEGVKIEESYASAQNWAVGEKVRFEAFSSVDAANFEVTVSSYSVGD